MNPGELLALVLACAPNVAPSTIQSIIDVESRGRVYAIGVNRAAQLRRQPTTRAQAVDSARRLLASGANFDAGLMQINSVNWPRLGLTPETVFDPCTNIRAGAQILTENYKRASAIDGPGTVALRKALSAYNTGSMSRGFRNGYVGKVERSAMKLAGLPLPALSPSLTPAHITAPASGRPMGVAPAAAWSAPVAWGMASLPTTSTAAPAWPKETTE